MASNTLKDQRHIIIEPVEPEDIDEIVTLENQAYDFPWSRKILLDEINGEPFSYVYVLRLQSNSASPGKIIGYNFFWVVSDETHILNIAVEPDYQGCGWGTQLLQFAIDFGQEQGAKRVLLEVRASNAAAQQLYHRLGFRRIGRRKKYYTNNKEDAYVMKKELSG